MKFNHIMINLIELDTHNELEKLFYSFVQTFWVTLSTQQSKMKIKLVMFKLIPTHCDKELQA